MRIFVHIGVAAIAMLIATGPAVTQGNIGGTIGKKNRSVSGETPAPAPHTAKRTRKATASAERPKGGRCPNIVGTWNSWATSLFGEGDAVFKSDGTATHRSGIPGKWACEDGQLHISWGGNKAEVVHLSPDRKKIICASGNPCFSKN